MGVYDGLCDGSKVTVGQTSGRKIGSINCYYTS